MGVGGGGRGPGIYLFLLFLLFFRSVFSFFPLAPVICEPAILKGFPPSFATITDARVAAAAAVLFAILCFGFDDNADDYGDLAGRGVK